MTALPNVNEPAQQGQTKKVEGWVDGIVFTRVRKDISSVRVFSHQILEGMSPATLLIAPPGSTAAPEVMEVAKVKAMLEEMKGAFRELRGHDGSPDGYATGTEHNGFPDRQPEAVRA